MYKLLIVDDESEIRTGLCNYIPWDNLGFVIAGQAENGKQALDFIQEVPPDVVLCDIKMPVMNGIELANELKCHNKPIKIIFLSGYRDFEYARQGLVSGVKDYIVKPTKYSELVQVFTKIKDELDREKVLEQFHDSRVNGCNYNEQIIAAIKVYVSEHFQDVKLEDVSELVHLNPFYLSKFFKEKTEENFSDFVMAVKMRKAAELLKDITYRTYQISEMVGYSNPKNFTRSFKKYFGKTPKEYRNSHEDDQPF